MKKRGWWIFLVLAVLWMCFLAMQKYWPAITRVLVSSHTPKKSRGKLQHIVHIPNPRAKNLKFSLTKELSEWITNFDILNNLVGTLVKRDGSGRLTPYLAERWSVSPDKKKWEFKLRTGLKCDNGEPLNAEAFVKHLTPKLLAYAKKGKALFEQLEGWEAFVKEDKPSLQGLFHRENTVYFHFKSVPTQFLESLSFLHFGYWHPENEKLAKKNQFISSAGYSLGTFEKPNEVTLVKRKDWPIGNKKAPQEVLFTAFDIKQNPISKERTLIRLGAYDVEIKDRKKYHLIASTPSILISFLLNPHKKGPFKDIKFRRAFAAKLKKILKLNPIETPSISPAESFYFNSDPVPFKEDGESFDFKGQTIVISGSRDYYQSRIKGLADLLEKVFDSFHLKVQYEKVNMTSSEWLKKVRSHSYYDLILNLSSISPKYLNMGIKLLFCTDLDIPFPDPSGRICRLMEEQDQKEDSNLIEESYKKRFNQSLAEDAAVIPLFHRRDFILHSKDLKIMPHLVDVVLPSLERMEMQP